MATVQERLTEAQEAYHALLIGRAPAEIRDQNGELVRYSKADPSALQAYIKDLETQSTGVAPSGPMRIFM